MYMYIAFVDYVFASLVAQMENNPPAMQKTLFQSLGWDNSLEDSMETHSSILALENPTDRGGWWAIVHRFTELDMTEVT